MILSFLIFFFFSSRRRHTRYIGDWSSDVCSSDLHDQEVGAIELDLGAGPLAEQDLVALLDVERLDLAGLVTRAGDRKSTRLNSSHRCISYAVFCLKKKKKKQTTTHNNEPNTTTFN